MLKQRVITALVLAAIVLCALFIPNPLLWRALITLVVLLAFYEWLRFCQIEALPIKALAYGVFGAAVYFTQSGWLALDWVIPVVCVLWLVLLVFTMTDALNILHIKWLKLLIGIVVLSSASFIVIEIKNLAHGHLWIVCFLCAVVAADIGAYFAGRRFGRVKLAPSISPGKTVEGFFGGLVLVSVIYIPVLFYFFSADAASMLLLTVLVTAVVSVGGDLFESKLKRHVGLKDSSQILPGHGGILDRIDSILAGVNFFALGLLVLGYLS
ncbi:phosphatidate cytidylyltransferase [Arenicella chitinivorans]|uniref:Phosphatidate cytidylyltransferase n=1 Tax=Arenicella chitinivorans TaxID=1329800 RepID=A0A918RJ92_9GAMM|nr:phosphatidate cytidylyltransferase [Arenicella chitinivorans]GHA00922.1 phosphatidate cytidylyltransferase [Arenicella chitinivorans]